MSNQSVLKTVISGDKSGITDKKRVLTRSAATSLFLVNIKAEENEQAKWQYV